jgi:hypothetical protein
MENDLPQKERDFLEKYAPHACCLSLIFSAGIMVLFIYFIYWPIKTLIS